MWSIRQGASPSKATAQHQVKAKPGDSGQRPPEADAPVEREERIAAKDALFAATHQQKGRRPKRAKLENLSAGERSMTEMHPSAPGQRAHQRRQRCEARNQAAKKVKKSPGASQVVDQNAASAFQERHQSGCRHQRKNDRQLRKEGCRGGEAFLFADKMKFGKNQFQGEAGNAQQQEKEQRRPSSAQTLAADEDPAKAAIFALILPAVRGFSRSHLLPVGGQRRLGSSFGCGCSPQWGLKLRIHRPLQKSGFYTLNSTDGKILYEIAG